MQEEQLHVNSLRNLIAQSGLFGVDQLPICIYIDNMHTVY